MPNVFHEDLLPKGPFSFIVHLFDQLLVGRCPSGKLEGRLLQAIEQDELLEGHFFDGTTEIFVSRVGGQLIAYEPIVVKPPGNGEYDVIERSYALESAPYNTVGRGVAKYNKLTVRERIGYEDHLAYVQCTMLCSLEERYE